MRGFVTIARYLLGLIYFVFGLNGFLGFIPVPEPHPFLALLVSSGYLYLVKAIEVLGGVLLLSNRYVPLGVTLLGPISVNILAFHVFFDPRNWYMAALVALLNVVLIWGYRTQFAGLFDSRSEPLS